jgi:hypothetical protein
MYEIIRQGLEQRFEAHPAIQERLQAIEKEVAHGRTTSFRAARTLLSLYTPEAPADMPPKD